MRINSNYLKSIILLIMFIVSCSIESTVSGSSSWNLEWSFSKNPVRQGDDTTITITFTNIAQYKMSLKKLGINFDWMASKNYYYFVNYDEDHEYIYLEPGENIIRNLNIKIDKNIVKIGNHSYYYYCEYSLADGKDIWGWTDYTDQTLPYYNFTVLEIDRDGDGVGDSEDAFPNDPTETKDSDRDGVGDNKDAFPDDPTETIDTDKDGVGNNKDAFPNDPQEQKDSDNDGVGDRADAFPNDPKETKDTDRDGVGDNKDKYPNDPRRWEEGDILGVGSAAGSYSIIGGSIILVILIVIGSIIYFIKQKRPTTQPMYSQHQYQPQTQQLPPAFPPQSPPFQQPTYQPPPGFPHQAPPTQPPAALYYPPAQPQPSQAPQQIPPTPAPSMPPQAPPIPPQPPINQPFQTPPANPPPRPPES